MNYTKDVAEMLGLEWDEEKGESEEFKLKPNEFYDYNIIFHLIYQGSSGVVGYVGYGVEWRREGNDFRGTCSQLIRRLIVGKVEIQKLPWKPKDGEFCWRSAPDYRQKAVAVVYRDIDNDCQHYLKLDLYRKTEALAIARTDEILKLMGVEA